MPRSRVLFRVDASSAIGTGHVARCRTLALELIARGVDIHVASHELPGALASMLEGDGITVHAVATRESPTALSELTHRLAPDALVLDGYDFDRRYVEALVLGRSVLLYIDDLGVSVPCDGVLNANLYAAELSFDSGKPSSLLLGPRFALVRRSFTNARAERRSAHRAASERVLVTMGGADPPGFTARVLQDLAGLSASAEVRVSIGASQGNVAAIEAASSALTARVVLLRGVADLAPHMAWCDVAVSAAGTTCLELACVGVPAVTVALADNQRRVEATLASRGLMTGLGWHGDVARGAVLTAVRRLLDDSSAAAAMSAKLAALVDGRGAERVADWLMNQPRT